MYAAHPCMLGSSITPYSMIQYRLLAASRRMKSRAPSQSERSASRGDCGTLLSGQQQPQMSVRKSATHTMKLPTP